MFQFDLHVYAYHMNNHHENTCEFLLCIFRYRNFRTFTSPRPVQFSCLTVDPSGEIVCAGGLDVFEIFVWSMQTGRLLDVRFLKNYHSNNIQGNKYAKLVDYQNSFYLINQNHSVH